MARLADVSLDDVTDPDCGLQVCFSTATGLLSWWIRIFTDSPVSHALLTFRSQTLNKVLVLEAGGHGFAVVPWSKWERSHVLVARFRLGIPAEEQLRALRAISGRLGDSYDAVGLFGFAPVMWYRLKSAVLGCWRTRQQGVGSKGKSWRPRFRNILASKKRMFCSEAVGEFLQFAGFATEIKHPADWSPKNLLALACASVAGEVDACPRFELVSNDENQPKTKAQQQQLPQHVWDRIPLSVSPGKLTGEDLEALAAARENAQRGR